MGIKKRFGVLILLILFTMPLVLALDTSIQVKTKPNYAVTIRALNIEGTGTLEGGAFVDQIADENGIVNIVYSSDTVNKIDISLMIKNAVGGTTIQFEGGPVQLFNNNGEHIKTGWPVEIDTTVNPPILIKSGRPEGFVEENLIATDLSDADTNNNSIEVSVVVGGNEEAEAQQTNTEIEAETKTGITGKAIGVGKSVFTSKITYSIIGVLFLVLVISFMLKKNLIKLDFSKFKSEPEVKKPEFKVVPREKPRTTEEQIQNAEEKLDQAKKELDEIKNRNERESRIRQAKEKYERDKAELENLQKEQEDSY